MHVAIEAIKLLQERRGIGRYMRNLLPQFVERDASLRFTMYVRRDADIALLRAHLATLHTALPALVLLWWAAYAPKRGLRPAMAFGWLVWPLAWAWQHWQATLVLAKNWPIC